MTDPHLSAAEADLVYVNDQMPGYRRRRCGRGFGYLDTEGAFIKDDAIKARIRTLAIPPAYTDVWICADPNGHLQATGRDQEGRKQYIYHDAWTRVRQEHKFERIVAFSRALPALRERIDGDLRSPALSRSRILAAAVRLMDRTFMRVGHDAYAEENGTYGLTTLHTDHVTLAGTSIALSYTGKSDQEREVYVSDPRLARVLRRCHELPGQRLFQFTQADGTASPIDSGDVNAYLKETMDGSFSSKDFRTWGGTVCASSILGPQPAPDGAPSAAVADAVTAVAERLGNTDAVCRKHYIHPGILDAYEAGTLAPAWQDHYETATARDDGAWLSAEEYATQQVLSG